MKILLDTCTFIWLTMPQDRLSPTATTLINDQNNSLIISDLSIWEISLKYSTGRISLPEVPSKWMPEQIRFFQLQQLSINQAAIYRSAELPSVHRDPFDRLLAAQAIEEGMTILSPDQPLSALGASRVW